MWILKKYYTVTSSYFCSTRLTLGHTRKDLTRKKYLKFIGFNTDVWSINEKNIVCLLVLLVFMADHQTFCSLFKVRRHGIRWNDHDIVEGFCSEICVWLSYDISTSIEDLVKKFLFHMGIEPRSFRLLVIYLLYS